LQIGRGQAGLAFEKGHHVVGETCRQARAEQSRLDQFRNDPVEAERLIERSGASAEAIDIRGDMILQVRPNPRCRNPAGNTVPTKRLGPADA
jgi:hypothetical protein